MAGANVMVSWTSWTSLNCNVENDKRRWNDDDDDDENWMGHKDNSVDKLWLPLEMGRDG